MHFLKIAFLLFTVLVVGNVLAQDEVIAQAYRTVNVRGGPGTQYDIIGQLTSGNEVQITGRSDSESNWLRISLEGREGWVAYFTVAVMGNTEQLPIVLPRSFQEAAPVQATATPARTQPNSAIFVTAYRTVNVRSGPGTEYVSVGNLDAGTLADVTGRSNDSEWLRIDYRGQEGWVAFFVVSLTGTLAEIAVVEVSADAETETPRNTVAVVTRYNINLRESPRLDSPNLGLISFGTTLEVEAISNSSETWLKVTYNGQAGWIIRALVIASGDLGNLPIQQ